MRNAEQLYGVFIHDVVVIIAAHHITELVEVLLTERALPGAVIEHMILAVNGVVGAEKDFFTAALFNCSQSCFYRYPCSVAVEVGKPGYAVYSFFAVAVQIHMNRHKVYVGVSLCRVEKVNRSALLDVARVRYHGKVEFARKLINRLRFRVVGSCFGAERMDLLKI